MGPREGIPIREPPPLWASASSDKVSNRINQTHSATATQREPRMELASFRPPSGPITYVLFGAAARRDIRSAHVGLTTSRSDQTVRPLGGFAEDPLGFAVGLLAQLIPGDLGAGL